MSLTENLGLPYLVPSQAQKHVTHNEALTALDALVQLGVLSRAVSTPPASPAAGERYIVAPGSTGVWAAQDGRIAAWQDGGWVFYTPKDGWLAYVNDENRLLVRKGAAWSEVSAPTALPERLGLNMPAAAPNRLALSGAASLFSHEGNGHRLAINKAAAADTASVLFQTGWSGRAEIGLTGDDDFRLKVSADGSAFTEALVVNRATGKASFPAGINGVRERLSANRTYYVATGGNDANNGLSAAAPFATLQKAVDEAHKLDCSIYGVTIQLADGSYAGATIARPLLGGGLLTIIGNVTTPANVILTSATLAAGGANVSIGGVKFITTINYQNALSVQGGARLSIGKVEFGQMAPYGAHVYSTGLGEIAFEQNYVISGGATRHLSIGGPTFVLGINLTMTLTGSPVFSGEFIYTGNHGAVAYWNLTVSGAATGKRYTVATMGLINLYAKAADFLPGTIAGTVSSGGVYA